MDWLTVIVCALGVAAVGTGYTWAYSQGYAARHKLAHQEEAKHRAAHAAEALRQEVVSRAADQRLREQAAEIAHQLKESQGHAKKLEMERDRALRAGHQRLSVRTTSVALSSDRTAQHAPAGPQEARAELLAEDAADIAAITADAEDATRALNSCIDQYSAAKQALDDWKKTVWKGSQHVETAKLKKAD